MKLSASLLAASLPRAKFALSFHFSSHMAKVNSVTVITVQFSKC